MKMEKAYRVKVDVTNFERYKEAFLHIYNNFKSEKELLYFENDYHDGIYLICTENMKEATEEYMKQFGETKTEIVFVKRVYYDMTEKEWTMVNEEYLTDAYIIGEIQ